jgi:hypothetical protein
MLAREVLGWCVFFLLRRREGDGAARKARKAGVRESTARLVREKVVEKRDGRGGDRLVVGAVNKGGEWDWDLEFGCLVAFGHGNLDLALERAMVLGGKICLARMHLFSLRIPVDWSAGLEFGELVMEFIGKFSLHSNTFPDQIAELLLHLSSAKIDADKQ